MAQVNPLPVIEFRKRLRTAPGIREMTSSGSFLAKWRWQPERLLFAEDVEHAQVVGVLGLACRGSPDAQVLDRCRDVL